MVQNCDVAGATQPQRPGAVSLRRWQAPHREVLGSDRHVAEQVEKGRLAHVWEAWWGAGTVEFGRYRKGRATTYQLRPS